jgi:seryl-tRNA synthetase
MNVLSFSSGKNLKGLATSEEDLVKLTDELQMEAQCIPNMLIHMLRLEGKIVQQ